jgi:NADH-quinone oxidoreductase subunit N
LGSFDLIRFLPEGVILLFALVLLFVQGVKPDAHRTITGMGLAGGVLALAALCLVGAKNGGPAAMLVPDAFSVYFRGLVLVGLILTLLFAHRTTEIGRGIYGEFVVLLMFFYLGAALTVMASNVLVLYLGIESLSIASYVCVAMNFGNKRSAEAGVKYVIFGAVCSALMLFGISLLYGMTGGLQFESIAKVLAAGTIGNARADAMLLVTMLIFAGFLYKVAAAPFHAWAPDAYEGGPTPFIALLSTASKAIGFAAMVRLFLVVFPVNASTGATGVYWPLIAGCVAAVTMTWGNVAALAQTSVKRMLAYSGIGQAGYLLMVFAAPGNESIRALLFYLGAYLIMNMGAFFCVQTLVDKDGDDDLARFKGLSARSPLLAVGLTVFLLSLTGLPPFLGFIGKYYLFAAVIHFGGPWYMALVLVAVANSVISLFYYVRVVREMFLKEPADGVDTTAPVTTKLRLAIITIMALTTVVGGLYWTWLRTLADAGAKLVG